MSAGAAPIWRRMGARSAGARALALTLSLGALAAIAAAALIPLDAAWRTAERDIAALERRAAALEAAARSRAAEGAVDAAAPADLAAATAWLDAWAPVATADAATLDLLTALRLFSLDSGATLISAAPLGEGAGFRAPPGLDAAGIAAVAAEARIETDHAGLAAFLAAVEASRPRLRATAIDVTARSADPTREAGRLMARIVVMGLRRPSPDERS